MANKDWLSKGADGLHFCERLGDLIANNKTTATAVSAETGISQSALSEYISGKKDINGNAVYRAPDCASLIALSKYFSVSTDYLLGLTNVKTSDADVRDIAQQTGLSESNVTLLRNLVKPSDDQCNSILKESISNCVICDSNPKVAAALVKDLIDYEYDSKDASAPVNDFIDNKHDPKYSSALVNDLIDYEYDSKNATELVNDFIEFAFTSGAILDLPFEHYRLFRDQVERSNKYAQEWNGLSSSEQYQEALAACDANNSALAGGLFPFAPEEAANLFLKIFCDSFYRYLHSKYPASKHPLNFGFTSRGD